MSFLDDEDTYSVDVICSNCGDTDKVIEDKGNLLDEKLLSNKVCDNCGCKKVFRRNFPTKDEDDNIAPVVGGAALMMSMS